MDAWLNDLLMAKRINAVFGTHFTGEEVAALPAYRLSMLKTAMEVMSG